MTGLLDGAREDSKKKTPLSAEEQKEFAQLQRLGRILSYEFEGNTRCGSSEWPVS